MLVGDLFFKIFRFFAEFDKSRFLNFFSRFIQYSCSEFIINFKFIGKIFNLKNVKFIPSSD